MSVSCTHYYYSAEMLILILLSYLLLVVDGLHQRQLFSCPYLPGSHPIRS